MVPSRGELPSGGRAARAGRRPAARRRRPGRGGHRPRRHRRQHRGAARRDPPAQSGGRADGRGQGRRATGTARVPAARAALRGGATQLGVATPARRWSCAPPASTRRCWPGSGLPGEDVAAAVRAGVDLGVSSLAHLDAVLGVVSPQPPRIHLKIDTGLGRERRRPGRSRRASSPRWPPPRGPAGCEVVGLMSHLASADVPGDPSVAEQTADLPGRPSRAAERHGVVPRYRHLANTAGGDRSPGHPLRPGPVRHRAVRAQSGAHARGSARRR